MKSITLFVLLCLCALGIVNSQSPISGYGNLSPYTIQTLTTNGQIYQPTLNPQPQDVYLVAGVSENGTDSFNAVYSNQINQVTLGLINYVSGAISDVFTFSIPVSLSQSELNGFQLVQKSDSNTLYFLADDIYAWSGETLNLCITNINSENEFTTTILPLGTNIIGQLAFDYTAPNDLYYVGLSTSYNQYQVILYNTESNTQKKTLTLNGISTDHLFKTFAYRGTVYIVQTSSTSEDVISILSVNFMSANTIIVANIKVSSKPNVIDISLKDGYLAIFSSGLKQHQPDASLIDLSNFKVIEDLQGLALPNYSQYFIF